ncbi:uncharacterized protein BDW43DRAFT_274123 [Aspergillus alliaceus]|uniref:uncharacterized protein n=1 Tax=Petromyces alliaceus TaxID=209559 RepID=UPI0012A72057|nr:uncharacterized protein BDW43DRAFT_274123 [Aspergillus alliaceus]KAB8234419.1 hypothetical protein BDW43DRAFT_274123 [Aspergillus alliaceus]
MTGVFQVRIAGLSPRWARVPLCEPKNHTVSFYFSTEHLMEQSTVKNHPSNERTVIDSYLMSCSLQLPNYHEQQSGEFFAETIRESMSLLLSIAAVHVLYVSTTVLLCRVDTKDAGLFGR